MKHVLLTAALAAFILSSCKKEYTCECTYSGTVVKGTQSVKLDKMKKADAKKKCDEGDNSDPTVMSDCSLK